MEQYVDLKILVKLPVKLGDTIMAAYFLRSVKSQFPNCQLDVIVARGLTELIEFMPYVDGIHEFSKKEFPGPMGNYKFGKLIRSKIKYDLLFCLPFSFSSAMASFFSGAKIRIGYAAEHRNFLFTKAIKRPGGLHIVEEFNYLLECYTGKKTEFEPLNFHIDLSPSFEISNRKKIVLNIKSGPPSRSIPIVKAISLIQDILETYEYEVLLTGAPNEVEYISEVKDTFKKNERVINLAGKTNLLELAYVIDQSECMITSDSGNAHIANAVGTPTVVLFGAAHPHRAKPYDQSISKALRLQDMECVPCQSEQCKFGDNRCLGNIANKDIFDAMEELLESNGK
jgi:lipopolysaccharide heptosyltransferase II